MTFNQCLIFRNQYGGYLCAQFTGEFRNCIGLSIKKFEFATTITVWRYRWVFLFNDSNNLLKRYVVFI